MKKTFKIKGMHCNSCATLIEKELKDRVNSVSASYSKEQAEIDFDENKISENEIKEIIKNLGYDAESDEKEKIQEQAEKEIKEEQEIIAPIVNHKVKGEKVIEKKIERLNYNNENKESDYDDKISKKAWFAIIGTIVLVTIALFYFKIIDLASFKLPKIQIPELGEKTSLLLLFAAGILTGFHCISMCGGFIFSYTAKNAQKGHKGFKQHFIYGGSKVLSYALIGGIFGLIGGIFAFSIGLRGAIAILAGIFMIFYALSMFGIKFFRKFQFNPKFLTKFTSKTSENAKGPYKAPFITGLLNGLFIACGPLQAMYLYAAGTGNFFTGATSLASFGLGTLPVMIGFGSLATAISHKTTRKILKISAIIVLVLGLIMLNRGLTLIGSPYNYESIKTNLINPSASSLESSSAIIKNNIQEINMDVDDSGYSPKSFILKKGTPVKWNVNVKRLTGCNSELIVNNYGINKRLKQGLNIIEFTPDKTGTVTFSCGMGMLRGSFIITETGTATKEQVESSTPKSSGSCNMGSGGSCGGSCGGGCGCGG